MSRNARLSLIIIGVVVVVLAGFFVFNRTNTTAETTPSGGQVTVVEYLDFECPSCRAAYPAVEKLRAEYGDKVAFTVKHFPLPMHRNAELASAAVEAAAAQGKREEMVKLVFETQQTWGGQQTSQRAAFVEFAQQLGLDQAKFEASLTDPAVLAKISKEKDEGARAGARGTPTFFINGTKFSQAPTFDALKSAIDEELGR